jgi:hypothetical protein
MMRSYPVLSERPGVDAEFKYTGVAPGRYTIMARVNRSQTAPESTTTRTGVGGGGAGSTMTSRSIATSGAGGDDMLYAVADVDVTGADVSGVTLALQPGSTFSGRVVFDAAAERRAPDASAVRLTISQPSGTGYTSMANTIIGNTFRAVPAFQVRADGTFSATAIAPGLYTLRATIPGDSGSGWWLRSAIVNGRDVLDFPLEFTLGRDLTEAVLTFSDRRTELTGLLQKPAGDPAPEHFVIVFPSDRAYWTPQSRRIVSARPATDGRFVIRDLPAGDYLLAALTDLDPDESHDARFLEQLAPAAIKITLADGERKTQDLRVGGR